MQVILKAIMTGLGMGGGGAAGLGLIHKLMSMLGGQFPDMMAPAHWNDMIQRGQITGQGYGEGLSSWWHGVRMAGNPLDRISQQMGQQIEVGVREQGLHGHQANRAGDAVARLVNDTGIDYQKAIELVTDDLRHGTASLKDFVKQITALKDVARDTGLSMKDLVDNMQDFVTKSVDAGGRRSRQQSGHLYTTLENQLGISKFGGDSKKSFEEFLFTKGKELTTLGGGNPLMANTPEGLRRVPAGLQKYITNILAAKPPGMENSVYAAMLVNSGAADRFFPGLNNDQITLLFNRASHHGGIEAGYQRTQRHQAAKAVNAIVHSQNVTQFHPTVAQNKAMQAQYETQLTPSQHAAIAMWKRDHPNEPVPYALLHPFPATDYLHSGVFSAHAMKDHKLNESAISQLDQALANQNVSSGKRAAIRDYLRSHEGTGFHSAQSRVSDNLNIILKLDAAETRKFLNTGQLQKNSNLQKKQGVDTTRTRGAR